MSTHVRIMHPDDRIDYLGAMLNLRLGWYFLISIKGIEETYAISKSSVAEAVYFSTIGIYTRPLVDFWKGDIVSIEKIGRRLSFKKIQNRINDLRNKTQENKEKIPIC